jgi:hypothetical protein
MLKIVFRRGVSPPGLHIRTLSLTNWGPSADVVGELTQNCQLTLRTLYSQPAGSKISLSHRNTVVIGGIARVCTAFESPPFNIHCTLYITTYGHESRLKLNKYIESLSEIGKF